MTLEEAVGPGLKPSIHLSEYGRCGKIVYNELMKCLNLLPNQEAMVTASSNFAMLGGIIIGRNDYQKWFQQHNSWCLWGTLLSTGRNDFAVLVGPIGEIKGVVKCSLV